MTRLSTFSLGFWRSRITRVAAVVTLGSLLASCGDPQPSSPSVGTNSNWLRACASDDQCDVDDLPACECGACTTTCAVDADCEALENARCALGMDPAVWAACESRAPAISSGICLPRCAPGACDDQQACVDGACVLAPLPDVAFCAPVAGWDVERRQQEEELLALVAQLRSAGGVSCGSAAPSAQASALRYDTRLVCAARVWADDIERGGAASATDSAGRSGEQRILATGYSARLWGDSYAVDTVTAADALARMLEDEGSCQRLTDPTYTDIGVGAVGQTWVVTIASE